MSNKLVSASATKNEDGDRVGALNKFFEKVYGLRTISRKFKKWNRTAYKITKYTLFFLLIYWIFL